MKIRILFEKVREYIDTRYRPGEIIIIEAPTAYGKTVSVPVLYYELFKQRLCYNVLHVLPLRTIIRDYYLCKLLYSFGLKLNICKSPPPKWFKIFLNNAGFSERELAYQMGDYLLKYRIYGSVLKKEPTFDARYVVTSFDSFAYNILRIPVIEIFRNIKHYAIPRARIFTSALFMDEAHLVFKENTDANAFLAVMSAIIKYSVKSKVPLIMMSATLNNDIRNMIKKEADGHVKAFRIWRDSLTLNSQIMVRDPEFEALMSNIYWVTRIIGEKELTEKEIIKKEISEGKKVLIVRYKVNDVIKTYMNLKKELGSEKVGLLHGKMNMIDRENTLNRITEYEVLITTDIIEAGVDWSFDTLVSDHPSPMSIVQQVGRICRHIKDEPCEATIYIIRKDYNKNLIGYIKDVAKYRVEWRLPYNVKKDGLEYFGISSLLENTCKLKLTYSYGIREDIEQLMTPLFLPSTYINTILRRHGYSILRTLLTQVITDNKALESSNPEEVIKYLLTINFKYLMSRYQEYLDYFVALGISDTNEVEVVYKKALNKEKITVSKYVSMIREGYYLIAKKKMKPFFIGFVAPRAYIRGLGLV